MERVIEAGKPPPETLVKLLERSADVYGDRVAVLFKPGFRYQRWSFRDLWEQSGQVAALLQKAGLAKGDRVIIWGPNSPYWVLAFFGCLRAGGVAVPIDLRSADDFVQRVVSKTKPRLAFLSRFLTTDCPMGAPVLDLEDAPRLIGGYGEPEEVAVAGSDLAEIMFTSGTTGDPKGVMLTHTNLMANLAAGVSYIPGTPSYRLLSMLPLSHMFEQMGGLLLPLQAGANVTYTTSRQPSVLSRLMQERKVTTMLLVPQALELFMNGIEREVQRQGKEGVWRLSQRVAGHLPFPLRRLLFRQVHKRFGGHLDLIVSGGAALDLDLGRKWENLGVHVIQGYGATEASPVISIHPITKPRFDCAGLPLPGVEVKIAADGEVLAKGPNIFQGYWEDAEKTAAALEDGWYKTGDLGEIDGDGYLHIRGRKKDMIALPSGQKVFPEDIEAVLNKHPDVIEAAVVGLPRGTGIEVHAALLMSDPRKDGEAVAWANAQLAEFQRVRAWTIWPQPDFPRTHTLKVKKNVVLDVLRGAAAAPKSAPATPGSGQPGAPRDLRAIIAEVGAVSPADVAADKTLGADLDLDSLKRVDLLSAVEEELGVYLDESQVGPETTVGQLEAALAEGSRAAIKLGFAGWGRSWWCSLVRRGLHRLLVFPLLGLTYRLRVRGRENLKGIEAPVLFAANHGLLFDNGLFLKALPAAWRRRLAIAGAADLWRQPLWRIMNPLLGNGFPVAREGAVRESLENVGKVLDEGWSVLIYPEGELTIGGPMKPFMSGVGLIAEGAAVPVVPMRLRINDFGRPRTLPFLKRGDVEVLFGAPMTFEPDGLYANATEKIEAAVGAL